ncbi:KAP family NTPase [Pseudomonas sp. EA_35y_Pfl2_R111]|uniref:KAP family NTPase n=1 Tax=Pseudomonas sp. EA_35y_Pfl2_R111 TaxID=3088689 RepID=UPI0030DB9FF8
MVFIVTTFVHNGAIFSAAIWRFAFAETLFARLVLWPAARENVLHGGALMATANPAMKMPELLVFARLFAIGFFGAEVWRIAFILGSNFAPMISDLALCAKISGGVFGVLLCLIYAEERGAFVTAKKLGSSFRLDLLVALGIGIWANELISPSLSKPHAAIKDADALWAPAIFVLLCAVLLSPILQKYWPRRKPVAPQLYFITDDEIEDENQDVFASKDQARLFADTVLASGAHPGLVIGVDGPWGVGKTSFMNLAQRRWEQANDKVIVCRFEPLRYASEPDLADRLIRDLSATIQEKVYAPEFRPAVSRYSRLIKGKADVSFLGFKLSLDPSQETVDELLDDIDEVLKRINRRVIIVIDDLDRLDAKTTNNVLFATRRTFRLSQATYVLCYDTEVLAESKDEGPRAREFLEKFVTVKLSLFVDSSSIRDFLLRDWQRAEKHLVSVPAEMMFKLRALLSELAGILDSPKAPSYLPLVGDLRKVKRFINAMLLMQLEKSDLGRTDFNHRDLINLMLLHLNYPGLFRQIYAEETEGRSGSFSIRRGTGKQKFQNSEQFADIVKAQPVSAAFLLEQLFSITELNFGENFRVTDSIQASRACFNQGQFRNLENYLKLIVRFATPMPEKTYVFYQNAIDQVKAEEPVTSILTSPSFQLEKGDRTHSEFWQFITNQIYDLPRNAVDDLIDTLVEHLPQYTMLGYGDRGLRKSSIFTLLWILNHAGWGATPAQRRSNTAENIREIAWRIFGEHQYADRGLIYRLAHPDRGILGWNDLMIFRLQSCMDRQGQLFNLNSALILDQDANASTTGAVFGLTTLSMRRMSQEIFALFKRTYIDTARNFHSEIDNVPESDFLGRAPLQTQSQKEEGIIPEQDPELISQFVAAERSGIKSFITYQLTNALPPTGSGIGCGFYDETGDGENHCIAELMNDYMFDICFNPTICEKNALHFLNHCLSHLSHPFFSNADNPTYYATKSELPSGLNPTRLGLFWAEHGELIRGLDLHLSDRRITTVGYSFSYREKLLEVFTVLDELARDAAALDAPQADSLPE